MSGKRLPGALFGGEIEASEALGISRTAYREAIRILAAKGLVESKPKAGTRVTPRTRWNLLDPDVLNWMFDTDPGEAFIGALYELQAIVTPDAAALAAVRRSPADLAEMDAALADMDRLAPESSEGQAAGRRFYRALLVAARNELLASIASTISAAVSWAQQFQKASHAMSAANTLADHRPLLEAIRAGDAAAARDAMSRLIDTKQEALLPLEAFAPG